MEQFTFTKEILDFEGNKEAISNIEEAIGRSLIEGETLHYDGADCNGKTCDDGYKCVLGNCVKNNLPEEELEP